MRRILSGGIEYPHFGQRQLSAALTFSKLIFGFRGIALIRLLHEASTDHSPIHPEGDERYVLPARETFDSGVAGQCQAQIVGQREAHACPGLLLARKQEPVLHDGCNCGDVLISHGQAPWRSFCKIVLYGPIKCPCTGFLPYTAGCSPGGAR
jgi:hypothetical protein